MTIEENDETESAPVSGPFCRHWGDPNDCEKRCDRCGHACWLHDQDGDGASCHMDMDPIGTEPRECSCEGFVDEADR